MRQLQHEPNIPNLADQGNKNVLFITNQTHKLFKVILL